MSLGRVRHIVAIPGDGVGVEVVPPAVALLESHPQVRVTVAHAGWDTWRRCGEAIPAATIAAARRADGVLFGCTSTPTPRPAGYVSPILELRRQLRMVVNIRHCRTVTGRPLDVVMVRDCVEGLYGGHEQDTADGAVADYRITRTVTRRLARAAAAIARRRGQAVTVVHKANVLPRTDGLFRAVAVDTLGREGVPWGEALADAAGYHLVRDPGRYRVMMMTSHVGDILSDVGAAMAGGLGLVPSLTLGDGPPLAEPIHGSAPDIAGQGIADPSGTILSAAMLVDQLGDVRFAGALRRAVRDHLADRRPGQTLPSATVFADVAQRLRAGLAGDPPPA